MRLIGKLLCYLGIHRWDGPYYPMTCKGCGRVVK